MLAKSVEIIRPHSAVSFTPFINSVRSQLNNPNPFKQQIFRNALTQLEASPLADTILQLEDLPKVNELLHLVYGLLTNASDNESDLYWGLCVPMEPIMFFGTAPFYSILEKANEYDMDCILCDEDFENILENKLYFFYSYIMAHFYDHRLPEKKSFVRTIKDGKTGLTKHFSISLDTSFVEVSAKAPLPPLSMETLEKISKEENGLVQLSQLLPMDLFSFTGFTVTTVKDISQQYALDSIRNIIVNTKAYDLNYDFTEVKEALKELVQETSIQICVLPLIRVNGKLINEAAYYKNSPLFSESLDRGTLPENILDMLQKSPGGAQVFHFKDTAAGTVLSPEKRDALISKNIYSYALLPLHYSGHIIGTVEIFSDIKDKVSNEMMALLASAKELLAQLVYNYLDAMDAAIEAIIKKNYTRLQPAVNWKFVEVAWSWLHQTGVGKNALWQHDHDIVFEKIYPLYGAVDIRNSTIERNAAMLKDSLVQLDILISVLNKLKEKTDFGLLSEKLFTCNHWLKELNYAGSYFKDQLQLTLFLENDVLPFLKQFTGTDTTLGEIAIPYFDALNEETGIAFGHRRLLETSMTKIITSINRYFDFLKDEIQEAYPCYFEKFRTDGVEYDIYIGQSIAPAKPYSDIYLKNLRLLQLTSMAAVARFSHALGSELPVPVETTQLIFIHAQSIDIHFRPDEKRFDVEGAYNIRYHIIKKRIDKVRIEGTGERLTQPGKIALVYFGDEEATEYLSHIKYLQSGNVLLNDLEHLQLEELSGVTGLKAMRVGVNLDTDDAKNLLPDRSKQKSLQ